MSDNSRSTCVAVLLLAALNGFTPRVSEAADPAGQAAFAECSACHSTGATNGVGPGLKGIVGRASAAAPGFAYSPAMKRAKLQWTAAQLDKYIANPQGVVPGNTMPYAGMTDATRRAALVAYLATLK